MGVAAVEGGGVGAAPFVGVLAAYSSEEAIVGVDLTAVFMYGPAWEGAVAMGATA